MKLIGSNGYDVGSPEYFRNINQSSIVGDIMWEFSNGSHCVDYKDALDKLCKSVVEVIYEVHSDLKRYAEVLSFFPKEEREETLKFLEKINEVLKFGYSNASTFDACKAYLTLSAYDTRRKSYESMSRVEEAAKKVENGYKVSFSTGMEYIRKALDYGINFTIGDDSEKKAFFDDVLDGKDKDFLQDVYNFLKFKKEKSSLQGKCFKTILSKDYIEKLVYNSFTLRIYDKLKYENSYYEKIKTELYKIHNIIKNDISKDGQIHDRKYVDNFLEAARNLDKILDTNLGAIFKNLSLDYEVVDITDELHKIMDDAAVEYQDNAKSWIKGNIEETYNFVKENIKEFISIVESNSRYDLKRQTKWQHEYFIYEGKEVRSDAPGNIVFGYIAKLFGFWEVIAKAGAGWYQRKSGTHKPEYWRTFFDDPYDQEMMKLGFDYYDRTYKGP